MNRYKKRNVNKKNVAKWKKKQYIHFFINLKLYIENTYIYIIFKVVKKIFKIDKNYFYLKIYICISFHFLNIFFLI